ncbi:DUF4435 domain-containing protein [Pseudidiomarina sp. YC-516-91]|uniref:DUF4435 domain-containing protein n=1 Tax=Pseudidiomarina salilacus TaxID=3384452 RepID=UPI0039849F9C
MAELEYSTQAHNVLNRFYRVDKMVFVEGKDDVGFWEIIFAKLYPYKVKVEPVGSKPQLRNYVNKIAEGEADYLVAMDVDYDYLINDENFPDHVITTVGYSIENSLVTDESLTRLIKNLCRLTSAQQPTEMTRAWIEDTSNLLKPLLITDVVNQAEEIGVRVGLDNSDRFFKTTKCAELCEEKIAGHIENLGLGVSPECIAQWEQQINELGRPYFELVRGHFIFSAAMRFVKVASKNFDKSVSLSVDAFYSNLLAVFELTFKNGHPHFQYYDARFQKLPEVRRRRECA